MFGNTLLISKGQLYNIIPIFPAYEQELFPLQIKLQMNYFLGYQKSKVISSSSGPRMTGYHAFHWQLLILQNKLQFFTPAIFLDTTVVSWIM